jgi:hypothetical protein
VLSNGAFGAGIFSKEKCLHLLLKAYAGWIIHRYGTSLRYKESMYLQSDDHTGVLTDAIEEKRLVYEYKFGSVRAIRFIQK